MKPKSHDSAILACLGEKATPEQVAVWKSVGLYPSGCDEENNRKEHNARNSSRKVSEQ